MHSAKAYFLITNLFFSPDLSLAATSNTFSLSGITEPVESETYDCVGNETSLLDCPTSLGDCGPDEMAVVSCQPCVDTCDYTSSRELISNIHFHICFILCLEQVVNIR